MKPEYEADLKEVIASQQERLGNHKNGSLEKGISQHLNMRAMPGRLQDKLDELSDRIEFTERMPRIVERIKDFRSSTKPTPKECDRIYEQVEKKLGRLEQLIKTLDGTVNGESISSRVLYAWSPEADLLPHIDEFRKHMDARKKYDAEKRKGGRPLEVWQIILCEELESVYRMIFDSKKKDDIYTTESIFTHLLQELLHRIEKGSNHRRSDIRSNIYKKKKKLDSLEILGN